MTDTIKPAADCRYYRGDRPCGHGRRCVCDHYSPMGARVLIIKLGALGDVVRTTCLASTVRRVYGPSHVTWVTSPAGARLLAGHGDIDRVVVFDAPGILALTHQHFDLVLSLDKEAEPAALCDAIDCADKRGIGLSRYGTVVPINPECEYYFALGLDDREKFFGNTKSYPELIHEAVGLPYDGRAYALVLSESARRRASGMFDAWRSRSTGPLVGLNTGSGRVFANKAPSPARWVALAEALLARGRHPVLLGGPDEAAINAWMVEQLGDAVFDAGCDNSESLFLALIDQCDAIVTGDTLALHLAVACRTPTVALFGPTCAQEIDLYGRGEKLIAPCDCGPCYRRQCEVRPGCTDRIPIAEMVDAVDRVLGRPARRVKGVARTFAVRTPA